MAKAPLPDIFPGEFFVLTWNRDTEVFILDLDDENHSSYDLGPDPLGVTEALRMKGFEKQLRDSVVDLAREFGSAQCIPSQNRVLPIISRKPMMEPQLEFEPEENHGWQPSLYRN